MDIVERLREFESVKDYWGDWEIAKEAADEIERLREALQHMVRWHDQLSASDIAKAEAALQQKERE
jgi:hypothetical protein